MRDVLYPTTFDFTSLTTFQGIEAIRGVLEISRIRLRADQLTGVTTFDSEDTVRADQVMIVGANVDLRGKTFVGRFEVLPETTSAEIKVSDFAVANLIKSATVRGVHVIIDTATLTLAQRIVLYDQGIDKVTDASGVSTTVAGPTLTGLQGDAISFVKLTANLIDVGGDATLQAEGHSQRWR